MISIITSISVFFLILMCLLFAYILRMCRREKIRVSVEEARENRRSRLVARRVRLREASYCGRCLLLFLFNIQDSCGAEKSCCGGRIRGRKNTNKVSFEPVWNQSSAALIHRLPPRFCLHCV